jgi:GalNAc5-diNAcBac-PP-undecaprenol beta-1,3-glucosyltransferase
MSCDQNQSLPIISVIVPTFRRLSMLVRALDSLVDQSYDNFEVIVIDDDSDQSVEDLVNSYKEKIAIIYCKSKMLGGAGARNIGIDIAKGKYIAFLDDDDYYHEDKLKMQIEFLQNNSQTDVVLCGSANVNSNQVQVLSANHNVHTALKIGNPYQINLMAKSRMIKELKFDSDLPNGQDWDLLVRLLKAKAVFAYITSALVFRDDGAHERITNSVIFDENKLEKRLMAINKHKDWLSNKYYQYRCAKEELAYISKRNNKIKTLLRIMFKYGISSLAKIFVYRTKGYI